MTLRNSLKLRKKVLDLFGEEFVTLLEEIEKTIEIEKEAPSPISVDSMADSSTGGNFGAAILSADVSNPRLKPDKHLLAPKDTTTITQAFTNVIESLATLPFLSELKEDNNLPELIQPIKGHVKSLAQAAELTGEESVGYGLIKILTLLAQAIVYLASILGGAVLGNAAGSTIPVMGIPGAVTGGIGGYKAADKALFVCSNYAGINWFNRRPYQAETTEKLTKILEKKTLTL